MGSIFIRQAVGRGHKREQRHDKNVDGQKIGKKTRTRINADDRKALNRVRDKPVASVSSEELLDVGVGSALTMRFISFKGPK